MESRKAGRKKERREGNKERRERRTGELAPSLLGG